MDEHRLHYDGWRVVGACAIGAFFATLPLNTFAVFLGPLCSQFSWSREEASSAFGALTLMAAFSAPVVGRLLDRFGARRLVVPCLALSALLVMALAGLSGPLWHLRVLFGGLGLLMMGASPIAYARAILGWFTSRGGLALGLMLTGAGLSTILLPPIAERLIRGLGWRAAYLVLGLGTLAIAVPLTARFIQERARPRAAGHQVPDAAVSAALRSRVFWTLGLVVFIGALTSNGVLVHIVALLTDRGVPAVAAAFALSAIGAASLTGRVVTGLLLDRFPAPRVAAASLGLAASGTLILSRTDSVAMGLAGCVCIGFGAGGEVDVIPYLLSRHFGARAQSTLYGLTWTAWGLAGAIGPLLMGRAFDATGSYNGTLVHFGAITLAAAGLMLTLKAGAEA
jgi:MFS family permease